MKRIALFVCLASACAFGQGGAATAVPTITNTRGEPVPYSQVAVCSQNPGSAPATVCNGLFVTLATDISLAVPCSTNVTPIGPISGVGCTNPGKSDGLGNVIAFATPGQYWCEYFGGSVTRPLVVPCFFANGSGGGANLNCPSALDGSIGAFTAPTAFSCDPNFSTDFQGNFTAQSGQFIGPVNGFVSWIGGGLSPGTQVKFKLPANTFRILAPTTVSTSYYFVPPSVRCAVGQVWGLAAETTDGNGDKVDTYQCQNAGTGVEAQVNGTDIANCTGGPPCSSPLLNFVAGSGITITNPSGGNIQIAASASSGPQMATPSAPNIAVGGTPQTSTVTYLVQGCQDGPTCAYHTLTSATATTNTANATLSSSPITLTGYGDTLYGPRCYNIYRTVGGPSQGKIATCVWKSFIDNGVAGDSTTATNTNTTTLDANGLTAPLPGCNKIPAAPWGVDGPPCSPTVFDDEFTGGNGVWAYGDTNNRFWLWGNQGGATTTNSNGAEIITPDTTNAFEYLVASNALPGTPYTFEAFIDANAVGVTGAGGDGCFIGLRESATGKIYTAEITYVGPNLNTTTGSGGWIWNGRNSTSNTPSATNRFQAYQPHMAYFKIQNTGTNIVMSTSPATDGLNFLTWQTQTIATIFTTAPNQLIIGGFGPGGGSTTCTFDFVRRTQ